MTRLHALLILTLVGCGSTPVPADAPTTNDDVGSDAGAACVAHVPACSDEQIAMLMLQDTPSGGAITEEGTTAGEFSTHVDATAGGFGGSLGYTYARFTDTGLEAVTLDDEAALDSTEWDIAFRRFILRLNSGVSGPGCVTGGRTSAGTTFDTLTSVPTDVEYFEEEYFAGATCEFIVDPTGMGPQTVLSSYFTYATCLAMTGNVYVIQLGNGRHVKLEVLSYYDPAAQMECETSGTTPTPSGSGNIRIRWAFLD